METIKFNFTASQARSICRYMKLEIKVRKCSADIYFNKQCLAKKIVPNYANIKVPNTSPAAQKPKTKPKSLESNKKLNSCIRKKDKIKFKK